MVHAHNDSKGDTAAASLTSQNMTQDLECPICAETYKYRHPSCKPDLSSTFACFQPTRMLLSSCCHKHICETCMYSHIHSILEEGLTGDGRTNLTCPFGCGTELTDVQVRSSFKAKHYTTAWKVRGCFLYSFIPFLRLMRSFSYWIPKRNTNATTCTHRGRDWILMEHMLKEYAKSTGEKNNIDLYYKWSLTVALSFSYSQSPETSETLETKDDTLIHGEQDISRHYVHVQHCPSPGCECIWLTSKPFREHKQNNEHQYMQKKGGSESAGSKANFKISLYQSASEWLFYVPSKPTEETDLHGDRIENWLTVSELEFINGIISEEPLARNQELIKYSDGRYITCPSCHLNFCGLCSRPWEAYGKKRISHSKLSCCKFRQKSATESDFVHQAIDARVCPGCGILTNRSSGCNHIRCSCGYEWCYVCECKWNSTHYSCVDGGDNSGCVII